MKKIIVGKNDLPTTNPELMKDWDYTKNTTIDPKSVSFGSNYKVWWKCNKCGYEWPAKICNRAGTLKRGCPNCSIKTVSKKVSLYAAKKGNLSTSYPHIAAEWHPTKNGDLKPSDISYGSEKEVWWKCSWCGNEWSQKINKRTLRNYGCPQCAKTSTSFAEQSIYYYLTTVFDNVINRDTSNGFELDIYIPSIKTAIEYDGVMYHKGPNKLMRDNKKDKECLKHGIRLIRFRDYSLSDTDNAETIHLKDGNNDDLEIGIKQLMVLLGKQYNNIDINKDTPQIMSLYRRNYQSKSLGVLYPEIAKELHPTKNGLINAEHILPTTARQLWWVCPVCGKEYRSTPAHRIDRGSGCPICAVKKVSVANQIKVINLDTGVVFDSLTEAAKSCNGRKGDICRCCNGQRQTASGYRWKYYDKKRRRHSNFKIRCVENGMIFDNDKEAAKWCNGDNRNINAVCYGRAKSYRGYRWEFVNEST